MRVCWRAALRLAILAAVRRLLRGPAAVAGPRSDQVRLAQLVSRGPFTFGSFHQVALAWQHLDAFSDHIYRAWIANSLLYAVSATVIVLFTAIPAGYGLALGELPGPQG